MPRIQGIFERKDVVPYLEARNLLAQYLKAKRFLLQQETSRVLFKERQPKDSGIWSFRINKQFRAFGTFSSEGDLIIFRIDNHQ